MQSEVALFDVNGRKVVALKPGANDTGALSPGVHLAHSASGVMRSASSTVTKVVLAR